MASEYTTHKSLWVRVSARIALALHRLTSLPVLSFFFGGSNPIHHSVYGAPSTLRSLGSHGKTSLGLARPLLTMILLDNTRIAYPEFTERNMSDLTDHI